MVLIEVDMIEICRQIGPQTPELDGDLVEGEGGTAEDLGRGGEKGGGLGEVRQAGFYGTVDIS